MAAPAPVQLNPTKTAQRMQEKANALERAGKKDEADKLRAIAARMEAR